ncbi:hypothetical protein MRB53_016565 [Persea americana]|uniref:Uncharacterized protein n=1 Tax=Persea americana TaxID=3435 RepID=A0ACC2M2N8_PERAE|nr:hypothetical protein MRB53_016565 [Persea americana]
MADVEEKQQKSSKTVSTDPNDHTIIKEGDADILIHANNEVFCNRTQVNNKDASIAVPWTFISKRKEEHAGLLSKKVKVEHQASEGSSRAVPEQAISAHDEKPNGECEVQMGPTEDEPIGISKEPLKTLGGKVCRELKPPRVLEALAASGLRALRYACEVEEIGQVIPVDNDKEFQKLKMGGTLVSARASRNSSALARSDDPAWKYGSIDPKNKNHIKCSFCERIIKGGGVTRFKEHLGGVSGEVAACKQVPHDIKWQMERLVMENRKNKTKKRQLNEEIENPRGTPVEEELEEDEDAEVEELLRSRPTSRKGKEKASKTLTQKRSKGLPPMANSFSPRTTPRSQPSIKYAMATKEQKNAVEMAIGRWWFDANIPFNAAKSKFYQPMCDAITSIGPGFKMPSYHDLRTRILKNTVEEVNGFMDHYKSFWNKTGCSIMADGWTDGKQRTLINFLVYCPKGVIFLKSIDASGIRKNADALFSMFDEVVLSVGPEKVVQFLTDNDATYKAAGQRVAEKYKNFYWTVVTDLRIKDVIIRQLMNYRNYNGSFGTDTAVRNRATIAPQDWWAQFGTDAPELQKLAIRILSQCCSSSGCERNWSIFEHIHSPKRNRLEYQRLNDLVFVHYNLKLRKRDMMKRTSPNVTDPISLENIDILDEWVCEEPSLLTLDDVCGWTTIEQPTLEGENIPGFDGGGEAGPVIGEELEAEDEDDGVV